MKRRGERHGALGRVAHEPDRAGGSLGDDFLHPRDGAPERAEDFGPFPERDAHVRAGAIDAIDQRPFELVGQAVASCSSVGSPSVTRRVRSEITKYTVESAAKEKLSDYTWWRGAGAAIDHYVTVSLIGPDGRTSRLRALVKQALTNRLKRIQAVLCNGRVPDDPRQLCKTSIIRDEWIAALSLDLSETERFHFVRGALGSIEVVDLATKVRPLLNITEDT